MAHVAPREAVRNAGVYNSSCVLWILWMKLKWKHCSHWSRYLLHGEWNIVAIKLKKEITIGCIGSCIVTKQLRLFSNRMQWTMVERLPPLCFALLWTLSQWSKWFNFCRVECHTINLKDGKQLLEFCHFIFCLFNFLCKCLLLTFQLLWTILLIHLDEV